MLGITHLIGAALLLTPAADPTIRSIRIHPAELSLHGPTATHSLLVDGVCDDGSIVDLTDRATFRSDSAAIRLRGAIVRARSDGDARIDVEVSGHRLVVPVRVMGTTQVQPIHFENDIVPILGRFGCNASGCHGKAEGQNGFKLSVFGSDPEADYAALRMEGRGRRLFPAAPERSLFLTKASGQVAHGGGNRLPVSSDGYARLRDWIAQGAPFGDPNAARITRIRIEPAERVMRFRYSQQLRIIATSSDGSERDVTAESRFQTNQEAIATVSAEGKVTALDVPGEATIMAAYLNEVATFRALVPRVEPIADVALPANNFIDPLVDAKLRKLHIAPSGLADDAEYLRRVYLDIIGTLPTPSEARTFLADRSPNKRAKLVNALLERPEYADYWALKWADALRVERGTLGHRRAFAYYRWIRESFRQNQPFDQFAAELITAEGPLEEVGPANFFRVVSKPGEAASTVSQVFLGIRIACAECHHHPFDRWSQNDYYGMLAYFAPVTMRKFGDVEAVLAQGEPVTLHPRTKAAIPPTPLLGPAQMLKGDRRPELARWLTAPSNPFFAKHIANRYWAHFFGRGIVDPVDDVRATNPPSNPELLDALAKHLIEQRFDVKQFIRSITASRTYQLASKPNPTNQRDEQNYSRALLKRMDAEVLLDAIVQTTRVPEKFQGVPSGSRAIQLWDSKVNHYFLRQFGRPARASACECERNHEPNVAQVLHLLNAPEIQNKIAHEGGQVARWSRTIHSPSALVEEMYLTFFSRYPTAEEKANAVRYLEARPERRREAIEDLAWAFLNSTEFVFNH